ncbi:MAG: hypothetical protein FWE91_02665 [Defluviitaleaceae bacterium]|nr:hypothetical protein [Defluviitaleaceae bacterium]MCL2835568.1 hypothetical protein [Defluviitaleaceae bacterium]
MNVSQYTGYVPGYKEDYNPLCMKTAIKGWKDKLITGLNDEDKKKIDDEIKAYLDAKPIETQSDIDAFHAFVKSLIKKFGFKGNVDDFLASIAGRTAVSINNDNNRAERTDLSEFRNLSALGSMGIMSKVMNKLE